MKTLEEAINEAARDLPDGWTINMEVECGSAWIELNRPTFEKVEFDGDDCTLAEQVENAVKKAIELKDTEP